MSVISLRTVLFAAALTVYVAIIVPSHVNGRHSCSVGDVVIARTLDLSHHRLVAVLPDTIIPCDGLVTNWQFWAKQAVSFKAVVFRQTSPGSYQIVGINDIPATSINLNRISIYDVPESDQIQVQSGDILGIAQLDNNPLLAADSSNTATTLYVAYDPLQDPPILTEQDIADLRPGSTINAVTTELALGGVDPVKLEVSFYAEVKPAGCTVGDPVIARTLDLSHHRLVAVLPDSIIPCDGLVTNWRFWAKQAVSFKAVVFRQTRPGSYQIVGINDIPATSINLNQQSIYVVPESYEIQVRSGDILGIAQFDNNPLLAADSSNTATTLYVAYDPLQDPPILTAQDIADLRPGSTINAVTTELALGGVDPVKLEVSFYAEVKPGPTGQGSRITMDLYQMLAIVATSILCLYWQL